MKHMKLFEQFISEEETPKLSAKDIFIPRRLKERWDDLLLPYLNKGYTKEQIFIAKPFNKDMLITKNNIEDFKNIKVIISNVRIKEINDLRELNIEEVVGNFDCSNTNLTSLEGAPMTVNGYFSCFYNKLTSLEGAPVTVNGYFYCSNNKLTSLEGAPVTVNGGFDCSYNYLTSLEGAPTTINGWFDCSNNTKKFTKKEVIEVIDVKEDVYV